MGEPERATRILDATPEHAERPLLRDLGSQPLKEPSLDLGAMLGLQLLPLLGLGRIDKVEDRLGVKTELPLVVAG